MAVTSGIHSGKSPALYAEKRKGKEIKVSRNQVREIRERTFAPMQESRNISWHEFEDVIQRTLSEGMGPVRSSWGMEKALKNLEILENRPGQVIIQSNGKGKPVAEFLSTNYH